MIGVRSPVRHDVRHDESILVRAVREVQQPYAPQHFLYFFPLPQGQGSLRRLGQRQDACAGARPQHRRERERSAVRSIGLLDTNKCILKIIFHSIKCRSNYFFRNAERHTYMGFALESHTGRSRNASFLQEAFCKSK